MFSLQHYIDQHELAPCTESSKKYHCDQCMVGFLRPGQLQAHIRKHTGEKSVFVIYLTKNHKFAFLEQLGVVIFFTPIQTMYSGLDLSMLEI